MGPWWFKAALTYSGYFTMGFVLILPVFNTFLKVWSMKSVGGGTRVEPFVVSLLAYSCSFMLAVFDNKWEYKKIRADESSWINGISTLIYLLYLYLFLRYVDNSVRRATLRLWVPMAVAYLGMTMMVGFLTESTVGLKWICMIAGVASSGTPLFLSWFVMEKYVENLPDWFSSAVGLVHYTVWIFRELDFYSIVQNSSGAISSLAFLIMLFMWRNWKAPTVGQEGEEHEPLLRNQIDIEVGQGGNHGAQTKHNLLLPEDLHSHLQEPLHPQESEEDPEAERAARSAPTTPKKAVIHKRSASV